MKHGTILKLVLLVTPLWTCPQYLSLSALVVSALTYSKTEVVSTRLEIANRQRIPHDVSNESAASHQASLCVSYAYQSHETFTTDVVSGHRVILTNQPTFVEELSLNEVFWGNTAIPREGAAYTNPSLHTSFKGNVGLVNATVKANWTMTRSRVCLLDSLFHKFSRNRRNGSYILTCSYVLLIRMKGITNV